MYFHRIVRDFLLLLFALYFAQGWLYASGSIISRTCLAVIIMISFVYFIKTLLLNDTHSLFYQAWTFFIILNIIGFIVNPDLSEGNARDLFKNIMGCMFPFYPFYYFAKKDVLKATHLVRFFFLMLPITIFQFFNYKNIIQIESNSYDNEVVNNIAYSFVSLLPFVFLVKNRRLLSSALMALVMLFIIQGSKRGAIIAGVIGMLVYIYYQIKTIEKHKRITGYLGAIFIMIVLSVFAYKTFMNNEFLLNRMVSMLEGDTSYRETLYSLIFNKWLDSNNFWNLLFGFGLTGSLALTMGELAHNDWLQLLASLGVTGIIAYFFLFYAAIKKNMYSKWMIDKKLLMLCLILIWFFVSLISMGYTSINYFTYAIIFGFLIGNNKMTLCYN